MKALVEVVEGMDDKFYWNVVIEGKPDLLIMRADGRPSLTVKKAVKDARKAMEQLGRDLEILDYSEDRYDLP
jgi:hypothetical protein